MIIALIHRRLWLWKNRLVPSIFLLLSLPLIVFSMISLPLKNIIRFSLGGIPYDVWVLPGILFIISSFIMYPLLYREYFELRIHKKVLTNLSLSPHSKNTMIFSSLVVSSIEAFIVVIFSASVYASFISISINITDLVYLLFCLSLYNLLLGNLYISLSLIVDTLTTMLLLTFMIFLVIVFGNGYLIEFSFFPLGLDSIIKLSPISIPFQIFQKFNSTGMIDYLSISILVVLIYFWVLLNGYILKSKLRQ
tara:strand:- start:432 stop:1181 length:750 start_codon:yes stop_codon:yes gene_type:complete